MSHFVGWIASEVGMACLLFAFCLLSNANFSYAAHYLFLSPHVSIISLIPSSSPAPQSLLSCSFRLLFLQQSSSLFLSLLCVHGMSLTRQHALISLQCIVICCSCPSNQWHTWNPTLWTNKKASTRHLCSCKVVVVKRESQARTSWNHHQGLS